ncbi:competence type IV pilus minor pilin ComGF [Schinkia azotoformans]|uniref:ComG operon protein n=2 Tax=Schinkia azotoformans TaxID=1454 RepID=K6D6V1_SCHAZ|nr:competence type IV pilus minor pilin ComGF [Schinkia azotoformans]EKN63989.1 ComG operon protein [Schinkia azotoformans LMG 9581]MEC1640576.1 competence type IV pilus minor pilin ComGF [Schinkia azotoformans]MEC1697032.1 competence type IV pilus minor pilin ComGF [Schinkia azotoformans]MEC1718071.1 competence type IV pilus minor pilin ComGF [Schinkia azotoformans]MEC1727045.1 competence type IV pilus minor pilin ComGF [Schinkia azotoformans]
MQKNNIATKQDGFTMLNMLFAFAVFLVLMSFFPFVMKVMKTEISTTSYKVDLFFEHIRNDIVQAKELSISDGSLYLSMENGNRIRYQKYNTNIRRQVNEVGNEILLQNVDNVQYKIVSNGVVVSVEVAKKVAKKRLSMAPIIFFILYYRGG